MRIDKHRDRIEKNYNRANNQLDKLDEINRIAKETEETGQVALANLKDQRQAINRGIDMVLR